MSNNAPTLINLPPPPADPVTPDVPSRSGTPNSTTTSMSELSTVAIKDGHRGHLPHHRDHGLGPTSGPSHLDAERADRISRLAGLERVSTVRGSAPGSSGNLTPGAVAPMQPPATQSFFDATGNPAMGRERSTVGSASATGSVGARTTWAGSEAGDVDKMSEAYSQDQDMEDGESVGGMSEEGTASLVGFGEGARTPARGSTIGSPKGPGLVTPTAAGREAKMIDGVTYDRGVVDTTVRGASVTGGASGQDEAERIVRQNMNTTSADRMRGHGPGQLGSFGFEK